MLRPPTTFSTARLSAHPPGPDDASAALASYASDPAVTRFLLWKTHDRVEPLAEFFGHCAANWEKDEGQLAWLLFLKDTGTLIGSIGLEFEPGGKANFGYVLGKKFWGRGLAAEALTFLVDWSLAQPEIFRAYAYCDAENPASVRVMEKAGMVREGFLRRWHTCPNLGPEPRDCIVCAKVR
jgi:ribosomal-protein-alanine N-acetyltransferase